MTTAPPAASSILRPQLGRWFAAGLVIGVLAALLVLATGGRTDAADRAPVPPLFVEETVTSGLAHEYDGGFEYNVGGGIAVFDCDDDGFADLYVAGGQNPAGLFRNTSTMAGPLTFDHRTASQTDLTGVTGAYPVDIDGDQTTDLALLRVGENVLLRGLGDCRFERANEDWGFDGGAEWTAAFSAAWEGTSSMPTLAFGNYLALPLAQDNSRGCAPSTLNRPARDGSGYTEPIELTPGLCTLSVLFHDWDRTGRHDLRMANDRHYYTEGEEQLWQIEPDRQPRLYTAADGWQSMSIWGMGIAVGDVTDDGLPEVVLTSQGDNKLQTLTEGPGRPTYTDMAIRAGTTAHRPFMGDTTLPSTAWHAEFADVNNDGVADLFLSKGNVDTQADHAAQDPSNLLIGNGDATFTERAREAGVVSLGLGRGAAVVDLNLDGMLDLVEVNRGQTVRVWRNVGQGDATAPEPQGAWVALALQQPGGNADAIGSWVEVRVGDRTVDRQVTVGGGHAGGQLGWLHVGLGDAETAQVSVVWPDGERSAPMTVQTNQFLILERGSDSAREWLPRVEVDDLSAAS